MISINFEDVRVDDLQLAAKILELIRESQSIREKFGFESSKTNDKKDFHSQLVDLIIEKLVDYYNSGGKILWGISLDFPSSNKHVAFKELVENILKFEEEAADEIFGNE